MKRKNIESHDYHKAMEAFDGLHCLNCKRELPPLTSRKDRGRIGSVLMKCCDEKCKLEFIARTVMIWANIRQEAIERDFYTCQECGFKAPWNFWVRHIPKETIRLSEMRSGEEIIKSKFEVFLDPGNWSYKVVPGAPMSEFLEVHHIRLISEGGNEFDLANCITLCKECHKKKHSREQNIARRHITLDVYV